MSRVRSAFLGALAGAAGTAAMDALWYRRHRREGGTEGPLEWEFAAGTKGWDDVTAPGQVGHIVLRRVMGEDVPDRWARTTQNVVHWATGMGWGAQFGLLAAGSRRPRRWWGLAVGVAAWATSYATLPLVGLYKPIWEYDTGTVGRDLSAHLLYGATTGATFAAATRRAPAFSSRSGLHDNPERDENR